MVKHKTEMEDKEELASASPQAVTVQLPTFMKSLPCAWFTLIEAQFHIRFITNPEIHFYYAVSILDEETC